MNLEKSLVGLDVVAVMCRERTRECAASARVNDIVALVENVKSDLVT